MPDEGQDVVLNTVTVVRDDAMHLYGFSDIHEMNVFNLLVQVKGVGPKLALALLGGLKAQDLCAAISKEDAGWISTVPGVGKKTAERIILELKDKVEVDPAAASPSPAAVDEQVASDVVSALVNLGYKTSDCRRVLRDVLEGKDEPPPLEALIRDCLKLLSGRKMNG
jgi:Holliday junction DNA helicase RuvA